MVGRASAPMQPLMEREDCWEKPHPKATLPARMPGRRRALTALSVSTAIRLTRTGEEERVEMQKERAGNKPESTTLARSTLSHQEEWSEERPLSESEEMDPRRALDLSRVQQIRTRGKPQWSLQVEPLEISAGTTPGGSSPTTWLWEWSASSGRRELASSLSAGTNTRTLRPSRNRRNQEL